MNNRKRKFKTKELKVFAFIAISALMYATVNISGTLIVSASGTETIYSESPFALLSEMILVFFLPIARIISILCAIFSIVQLFFIKRAQQDEKKRTSQWLRLKLLSFINTLIIILYFVIPKWLSSDTTTRKTYPDFLSPHIIIEFTISEIVIVYAFFTGYRMYHNFNHGNQTQSKLKLPSNIVDFLKKLADFAKSLLDLLKNIKNFASKVKHKPNKNFYSSSDYICLVIEYDYEFILLYCFVENFTETSIYEYNSTYLSSWQIVSIRMPKGLGSAKQSQSFKKNKSK